MYPIPLKRASRIVLSLAIAALPFAGCDKTKDDNGTKPTETQKKHNVELRFDVTTDEGVAHIAMDTIYKYRADPTVDSILLIADPWGQMSGFSEITMRNVISHMRPIFEVSNVYGKGELLIERDLPTDIPDFFRNVGYNVILTGNKKIH